MNTFRTTSFQTEYFLVDDVVEPDAIWTRGLPPSIFKVV